jgi:hypothetical protein
MSLLTIFFDILSAEATIPIIQQIKLNTSIATNDVRKYTKYLKSRPLFTYSFYGRCSYPTKGNDDQSEKHSYYTIYNVMYLVAYITYMFHRILKFLSNPGGGL